MDEPVVLAVSLLGPFGLGLLLRLKGAVLAALGLAGGAVVLAADGGGSSSELVGAAVLGAGGGFALGWAGSLTRRLRRRG
jgi:drug/metabolite transporter (DMT)-like permease